MCETPRNAKRRRAARLLRIIARRCNEEPTTFAVAGDGTCLHMKFACRNGDQVSLSLPTECLHGLMMTFPRMMSQARRAQYHDETLRLVYPAENVRIELASDPKTIIVTLATPDGFEVSFGLTRQQMTVFNAAADDLEPKGADIKMPDVSAQQHPLDELGLCRG